MPSHLSSPAAALALLLLVPLAAAIQTLPLGLQPLMRTGDKPGSSAAAFGQLFTADGKPIYQQAPVAGKKDGLAPLLQTTKDLEIANNPDFQALLQSDGKLYLLSHFEGPRPSALYLSELSQDKSNGKLTAVSTKPVDMSKYGGIWIPCAGSITPWSTYLGGEEYEPDARIFETATSLSANESTSLWSLDGETLYPDIIEFIRYYGLYAGSNVTMADVKKVFNPYLYGHTVEAKVVNGSAQVEKWLTLGRNAKELAYAMPDNKTVYITDDGTNVGFFKFVADKPKDLSSGTLYAAQFDQSDAANGGTFDINWIKLGSANQTELKAKAATLKFSDIFEYEAPAKDGSCPAGFESVNQGDRLEECLKLKPGAEKWAAFFETRRYAAYLGATTEFSKWEGLTFSPSRSKIYTAMTEIRYGMEDYAKKGVNSTSYDIGGNNDVRLPYNKCGCVYELEVDATYNAVSMSALLCGTGKGPGVDEQNGCSVDSISSPDNVSVMDDFDILLIGEDTSLHQNDMVWALNLNSGNLTRIATTPYGAESTGVYWYPSVNGYSYIMAAAQHPYGESDEEYVNNPYSEGKAGYVGYFVMKSSDIAGKDIQFTGVPVPRTNQTKSQFMGSPSVTVY